MPKNDYFSTRVKSEELRYLEPHLRTMRWNSLRQNVVACHSSWSL